MFKVHTSQGILEFKPTSKGLHALNLKDNPEAAHLLVTSSRVSLSATDDSSPPVYLPPSTDQLHVVKTVRNNYKGFTKKQVQCANEARRIMLMMGVPMARAFKSMVRLNQLQDCPITIDDVKNAHLIWGDDLANKRVQNCSPKT